MNRLFIAVVFFLASVGAALAAPCSIAPQINAVPWNNHSGQVTGPTVQTLFLSEDTQVSGCVPTNYAPILNPVFIGVVTAPSFAFTGGGVVPSIPGTLTSGNLLLGGGGGVVQDSLGVPTAIIPSGTTLNLAGNVTLNGPPSNITSKMYWEGTIGGTCSGAQAACGAFQLQADGIQATATKNVELLRVFGNMGGSGMTGGVLLGDVTLSLNNPTGNLTTVSHQAFNTWARASVNDGGTSISSPRTNIYSTANKVTLSNGATFYNGVHLEENDIDMETGSSADYVDGVSVILASTNQVAGFRENVAFFVGAGPGALPTITTVLGIGGYESSGNPLAATASIVQANPHQATGPGPTITNGIHFAQDPVCSCGLITFTGNAYDSNGFAVDGSGDITGLNINATATLQANGNDVLTSPAAATWQLGAADSASPIAQTLNPQNVATGVLNTGGVDFTISGSRSTGNVSGGAINFKTSFAGVSGTNQNNPSQRMNIAASGNIIMGNTVSAAFESNVGGAPLVEVQNNSAGVPQNAISVTSWRSGGANPAGLYLNNANNNSFTALTIVSSTAQLGQIVADGADGTAFQDSSRIRFEVDGTPGAGQIPGLMRFSTANASGSLTDALIIDDTQTLTIPAIATGTPAASACFDSSHHLIEKTTSGACI